MKIDELVTLVNRHNPIWSDEIIKYITNNRKHPIIKRSLLEEHDCIVAELWNLTDRYYYECEECSEIAGLLYHYNKDHMPISFITRLEELYKHMFKSHGKLMNKDE